MPLPIVVIAASLDANWIASENITGLTGQVACKHAFPAILLDPLGAAACLVLLGILLAPFAGQRSTLSEIIVARFGVLVDSIASYCCVVGSILWAAAQYKAVVQLVTGFGMLPVAAVEPAVVAVLLIWTVAGGLAADVWLDFLSMLVTVPIINIIALVAVSKTSSAALVAELDHAKNISGSCTALNTFMVGMMGNLFTEELAGRILLARSPAHARAASFIAAAIFSVAGLAPAAIGIWAGNAAEVLGSNSKGELCKEDQDLIVVRALPHLLPTWTQGLPHLLPTWMQGLQEMFSLQGMFSIILIVESLNTVDTSLLMCSKVLADSVSRFIPTLSAIPYVQHLALATTLALVVGTSKSGNAVWELAEAATGAVGAPLAILCVFLPWRLGGSTAAVAGMCAAQIVYTSLSGTEGMPFVWSLCAGSVAYVAVAGIRLH